MKKIKSIGKFAMFLALTFIVNLVFSGSVNLAMQSANPELPNFTMPLTYTLSGLTVGIAFYKVYWEKSAPVKGALFVFTQGLCEKVQTSLVQMLGDRAPSLQRTKVGYLQALTSPENTAGVEMVPVDPGNGKNRKVRIKHIQRGLESDIVETQNTNCNTELEKEPFEQDVEVTSYIRTKGMKFSENEMRKLCEPDSDYMAAVISAEIDPFMVYLNKKLITAQAANFGKFVPDISPATVKQLQLLKDSGENLRYRGESDFMLDMEHAGVTGRPLTIGAGNLYQYAQMAKIGCCNDGGLNLSQAGAFSYYFDKHVAAILGGADRFIALAPGMVQLMTWNKYVGTYKKENDVFTHGTIIDPMTGIQMDMKWKYNDCDDTYGLHFGLWYDLYFLPDNAFAAGDELEGVNYSWHYNALDEAGAEYI